MSTHKTVIEQPLLEKFLAERIHVDFSQIESISDGETSQAYFVDAREGKKVLRVNSKSSLGFQKDDIALTNFGSDDIPIPKTIETGEIETGLYFSITERAEGQTLDKFSKDEKALLIPQIIKVLDAIHSQLPLSEGYGQWDENGQGKFKSWREQLEANINLDDEETREADFYDADFHDQIRDEVIKYFKYCPEVRQLVHGDFGFNNVICNGTEITGVIDWEQSMYGDPLYDVAWLEFWDTDIDYETLLKEHYESTSNLPENYFERMLSYKLKIGLSAMSFFARSKQKDKYDFARQITRSLLNLN